MRYVDDGWFTGEHGQQLHPAPDQQLRRPSKLPSQTQRAIDDIFERYPHDLNDEIPL
ncbi:hypothetical protein [Bradyrhizobium australafricanum]|uniref:hypothetical protein n=1 Tax=Bradyrhizobium australafricanum TaxID=2821406 RepID=UPI001CE3AEAD|nr:hypothetical protein [Bradyrhizobium australafricanum]MCA6099198.1 hypothetical protein [Bradyrhizobium australafricanum]